MDATLIAVLLSVGATFADDKKDNVRKAFQGTWTIVARKNVDSEPVTAPTVLFEGNKYKIKVVEEGTLAVDLLRVHRLPFLIARTYCGEEAIPVRYSIVGSHGARCLGS